MPLLMRYFHFSDKIPTLIAPLFLLLGRLWVAWVFFRSGYLKVSAWDSTLFLFELEYQVPLLPWQIAAYLGTAAELVLPVFLIIGLLTRPAAFALFVFNIIAVISYPALWPGGFLDHQLWGLMLLVIFIWGAGSFSIDQLVKNKFYTKHNVSE